MEKDISGCAIIGIINESGELFDGDAIIRGIAKMRDRSNGLGGGFAAYGIYPDYADYYAFHIMYENKKALDKTEALLEEHFLVEHHEKIPHQDIPEIPTHPFLRRYFVKPKKDFHTPILGGIFEDISDDEYVARAVFKINDEIDGAFVFSSGKNMGTFKAVGYPEDVGRFFKLKDYEAYCWIAHGRFPTNSQAWWGGAHPFSLLDIAVVHNGEISSYGINKRYLENYGYKCNLGTDTEVICYLWDLLLRKHHVSVETAAKILAPPFWVEIDHMDEAEKQKMTKLRAIYGSALLNGPFGIVVGFKEGMIGLNDRLKLRPLVAGRSKDRLYLSSEESAIIESNDYKPLDNIWMPRGGELVVGRVKK
ncbi:MAG: class II glutamine amidotransferase [Promethearchaeota archaeon]